MFNKIDLSKAGLSILLTSVVSIGLGLVACQDKEKQNYGEETEISDVLLQKIEKGELVSKVICDDKIQVYNILGNLKTPLKIESPDKYFYTNYIFKIYLLADKSYTGSMTSKTFDAVSNAPIREAKVQNLTGVWIEKKDGLELLGLGRIRKVKVPAKTEDQKEKAAEKETSKIELVISSAANRELIKKATQLSIEQVAEGPEGQKISDICAPVQ